MAIHGADKVTAILQQIPLCCYYIVVDCQYVIRHCEVFLLFCPALYTENIKGCRREAFHMAVPGRNFVGVMEAVDSCLVSVL